MATCCFQRVVILCLSASCFAFPTPHLAGQIVMSSKGNSYNNLTAHAPTQPPFVRDAYGFVTHRYFSFLYSWQKVGHRIHCPAMSFRSAGLSSRSRATRATHSGACSHRLWTASIAFPSCFAQSIIQTASLSQHFRHGRTCCTTPPLRIVSWAGSPSNLRAPALKPNFQPHRVSCSSGGMSG